MKKQHPTRREFMSRSTVAGMTSFLGACATGDLQSPAAAEPAAPESVRVAAAEPTPEPTPEPKPEPKPAPERRDLSNGEPIRIGFIGAGGRGSVVLRSTLTFDDVQIVAITDAYDVWCERAVGWCRKKVPAVGAYVRFEEMIAQEDLDAVIIATPDHIHVPAIFAALDAGLDVYTEKPMALSVEDAAAVQRRVRETGAVLQVGTQLRSMPMYQKARELVQSGAIGQVVEVNVNRHVDGASYGRNPPPEANASNVHWDVFLRDTKPYALDLRRYFAWRLFTEYSNGVFGDFMTHHLDLCHFVTGCGMPHRILAAGGLYALDDGRSCPDTVSAIVEYPERFHFNYTTTILNDYYGLVERYLGTEGTIEVRNMGQMSVIRKGVEEKIGSDGILDAPHLADYFNAIRTRQDPIAPVEAGFMASAVVACAMKGLQTGACITWDPAAQAPIA